MGVVGRRVSVATTATRVDASDTDGIYGRSIAVTNAGAAAVDLGGPEVLTGAGYSLAAGATISIDLQPAEVLYGVAASGTVVVHVIETGI